MGQFECTLPSRAMRPVDVLNSRIFDSLLRYEVPCSFPDGIFTRIDGTITFRISQKRLAMSALPWTAVWNDDQV